MSEPSVHVDLLVVEDNAGDADLIREALSESGSPAFRIVVAQTIADALGQLRRHRFDVVLLDLSLPDSRGLDTLHRLHSNHPAVPVIVLTGREDHELGMGAVNGGAQDFLVKGWAMGGGAGAWRSVLRDDSRRDPLIKGHMTASLATHVRIAIERHRTAISAPLSTRPASGGARIVSFVGAKGGVGTSTVALSVAFTMAQASNDTVALELRRSFGSFSSLLHRCPDRNLKNLIDVPVDKLDLGAVEAALVQSPARRLRVLFGPQRLGTYPDLERARVRRLLEHLVELSGVVVIDLPSEPSEANREAMIASHFVGLVTDVDPTSLIAGKAAIMLMRSWGVADVNLGAVVVNRSGSPVPRDLERRLAAPIVSVMPNAADDLIHAQHEGTRIERTDPKHALSVASQDLARRLQQRHGRSAGSG